MSKIKYKGDWLHVKTKEYIDGAGNNYQWEYLSRSDSNNSVSIIPLIRESGKEDRIILVKQFRPSIDKYILGLPTGRIMQNESMEIAALRELGEETGYSGKIIHCYNNAFYSNPQSSCEIVNFVVVQINDFEKKVDSQIELIDIEVMEISTLISKIKLKSEIEFDLNILSIFLQNYD